MAADLANLQNGSNRYAAKLGTPNGAPAKITIEDAAESRPDARFRMGV